MAKIKTEFVGMRISKAKTEIVKEFAKLTELSMTHILELGLSYFMVKYADQVQQEREETQAVILDYTNAVKDVKEPKIKAKLEAEKKELQNKTAKLIKIYKTLDAFLEQCKKEVIK